MEAGSEPERVSVQTFVPARKPLERYLASLWQELLRRERVGIHDDFFELGGNSLVGAALINRLYEAVQEDVALSAIFEAPTIAAMADYLERRHPDGVTRLLGRPVHAPSDGSAGQRSATATGETPVAAHANTVVRPPALVAIQPSGARPPLFCIHPAGGVVFPYYTLAPYLGKDQPLYGLQDPNLYLHRSTFHSIEGMAAHYVRALKTVQPNGPYHLLGWSVGGLVAYEMAQQLTRDGQVVAALVMLDTAPPAHSAPRAPLSGRWHRLQRMGAWVWGLPTALMAVGATVRPILNYVRSGLYLLTMSVRRKRGARTPTDQKCTQRPTMLDRLRWAGIDAWRARLLEEAEVATTVSRETSLLLVELPAVRRVLDLVGEHKRLARRYVADVYSGRITLVRAVPAEPHDRRPHNPVTGWGKLAAGGVETHMLRANHVALLVKPHVETLAHELRICLEHSHESPVSGADHQGDSPETRARDTVGTPGVM
jgi:thioesterase domain-containing protein